MSTMVCGGCGVEVSRFGDQWASSTPNGGWAFCCRMETTDTENPVLVSADYHYVEGEEQRHWRNREMRENVWE